ncbi:hypothetical protein RvVAR0630_36920 [Agrobacterium vitis]|nr:hypothetical protein RvVAR0630_36920 [Agrobacterium vitis]
MADEHGNNESNAARCDQLGLFRAPPSDCHGFGIMLMAVQAAAMRSVVMSFVTMLFMIMVMRFAIMMARAGLAMRVLMLMIVLWDGGGEAGGLVAKAGHPIGKRDQIGVAVVDDCHGLRRYRNPDIGNTGHSACSRVDFCRAGGAIHALDAKTGGLFGCHRFVLVIVSNRSYIL